MPTDVSSLLQGMVGSINLRPKNEANVIEPLGGCPRTNMPVSGYQYVVLFNSIKALYIVGESIKR